MKMNLNTLIFILIVISACESTKLDKVDLFLQDLKDQNIPNQKIIEKYFLFDKKLNGQEKKEAKDLVNQHMELLRQKINTDCQESKILMHDEKVEIIMDYNLNYSGEGKVYYIVCDHEIITPILIEKGKVLSITSYSKTQGGRKGLLIF